MKQRTLWIDVAKGIGILLVILGHMNRFFSYDGRMNQIIYSVQLPIFLVIGGYWMERKDSFHFFLSKKFYRLIQPYFLFAVFSILYAWPDNQQEMLQYGVGMLWGIGIRNYLPNLPIWFLTMFFVANIWFYLILCLGDMGKKLWQSYLLEGIAVCLVMAAGWQIKLGEFRLPWGFELAMITQGFFYTGYLARHLGEWLKGKSTTWKYRTELLLTIPALIFWLLCVRQNGRVDINAAWFGNRGLWSFYLAALCGCYLVFIMSRILAHCQPIARVLSLFGKNSMVIMAVHVPVLIWLDGVLTPLMPDIIKMNSMSKNWIGVTYTFVGVSLLSLFAAYLLKPNPFKKEKN